MTPPPDFPGAGSGDDESNDQVIDDLIADYLDAGEPIPEPPSALEALAALEARISTPVGAPNTEAARYHTHISLDGARGGVPARRIPLRSRRLGNGTPWWTLVAAGLGIAAAGVLAINQRHTPQPDVPTVSNFVTGRGQRAKVTLADGSTVNLAPDSRLRVSMSDATRSINLEGEATFTVVHRPTQPFIVHARNATTTDIGTTFGVRNYPEDPSVRIAVKEGRVAANSVVLNAGDMGRVRADGVLSDVQHDVAIDDLFSWQNGKLVFRNARLRNVVTELSRMYDVDFVLGAPELGDLMITVTFDNDPLPEVTSVLSAALKLKLEHRGRTITIMRSVTPTVLWQDPGPRPALGSVFD